MKILFCIGSMRKGGAERVISVLSNYFIKDHELIILTTIKNRSHYELDKRIKHLSLDNNQVSKFLIKRNSDRVKKMKEIIIREDPDIIISFLPEQSFRILSLKKKLKKKIIVSVRNDPKREYKSLSYQLCMRLLYKKADGFVFQTVDAKKYFNKKIQDRSIVIENPINEDFFSNAYDEKKEKIIVTAGRLTEQKNQTLLINAFSKLNKKYDDYKLFLYGDGKLKESLMKLVKDLSLEKRVIFKGISNNLKKDLKNAKLFVLSSDYEGMPNALMEAMALGLPVISTDCPCGGPRHLIKNSFNGLLIENKSEEELTNAIQKVLDNEELALSMGKNATTSMQAFKLEIVAEKWLEYIEKVVGDCK